MIWRMMLACIGGHACLSKLTFFSCGVAFPPSLAIACNATTVQYWGLIQVDEVGIIEHAVVFFPDACEFAINSP